MKSKIIYLCYIPLNNKLEIDFYMYELFREGISIEYWDLTKIFFRDITFDVGIERPYIIKIRDYKELEKMITAQDIKKCFFIVMPTFNGMVIRLHRILTKYGCYLIYFARSGIPPFSSNESTFNKIVENYRNYLKLENLKERCLNEISKIFQKLRLIKNYNLVFAAGYVELSRHEKKSKVIHVNHFDYDKFLYSDDKTNRIVNTKYCIFLDDNIVYDADLKMINMQINPIPYFKSLCSFFDYLENNFNVKVIIAAHPKAQYHGNEFGDRIIIKDKTIELAKHCNFAITHFSTSVAFAVLYEKPLLFVYTEEIKARLYYNFLINIANELGADIYNIDNGKYGVLDIKEPDLIKYNKYKYNYLTSRKSENNLTKNIFMDYICSYWSY